MKILRTRTREPLYDHQKEAIQYGLKTLHPAFLMEMRLGKTRATIHWIKALPLEDRPSEGIVVVAPVGTLEGWEKELRAERESFTIAHGLGVSRALQAVKEVFEAPDRSWLLLTYESIREMADKRIVRGKTKREIPLIALLPWYAVILDESPKIANPQTQVAPIFANGFRQVRHRAILSGLPRKESELDLFMQFKFLDGHFMGYWDFWHFRSSVFEPSFGNYDWQPKYGNRTKIKEYVHNRAFVRTRMQTKMGSKKEHVKRYIDMTPKQEKMYREIEREYAYNNGKTETKSRLAQRKWMEYLAGGFDPDGNLINPGIADDIVNISKHEIDGQVVCWFNMRHELEYLSQRFTKARLKHICIDGQTPRKERNELLTRCRNRPDTHALVMERCAQFGVDASFADTAIYYSNDLSTQSRVQSEDRIIHPSKKYPLLVIDMITRGTLAEDVAELVSDKSVDSRMFMVRLDEKVKSRWV